MSLSSITSASSSAPPASQKAGDRPIGFVLNDGTTNTFTALNLIIRPEELTHTDVSRTTVQQTLGGAWADDFGPGLGSINISGTTGWRGNSDGDGMTQFAMLKAQVFDQWHALRNAAVQAGNDPSLVTLQFCDTLDSTVDTVIPMNFTLRRSKSRPLLMQFNISMIAISDTAYTPPENNSSSGLSGLLGSIKNIISSAQSVVNLISSQFAQVSSFMYTATSIFQGVTNPIESSTTVPDELLETAVAMAQAGSVMFSTIANTLGLTTTQSASAMSTASDFSNILCLLSNTVNQQKIYQDYTPLYGASNCSSTNGGSPTSIYAGTNPFYAIVGAPQNAPGGALVVSSTTSSAPVITVFPTAAQSLLIVNNSDPVLAPMSLAAIGSAAASIGAGVSIS